MKLTVKIKIHLIALLGSAGFIAYLLLNLFQGQETQAQLDKLEKQQLPVLVSINEASLHILQLKDFLSSAISSSEESMIEEAEKHSREIVQALSKIIDFNNKFSQPSSELLQNHKKYWVSAKKLALGMINETVEYDQLAQLSQKMHENFEAVNSGMANLRKNVIAEFSETVIQINTKNTSGLYVGLSLGVTMIFLLLSLTHFISNNITKSIVKVSLSLNDMATRKADLTRRLPIQNNDEVSMLIAAFNSFLASMERLIGQTINVSKKVSSQAENLHSIALQTHNGIVDQQQEIHMVATAVTELSASSSQVSTNANDSSSLTQKTTEETNKSYQIIQENRKSIDVLSSNVSETAEVLNQLHSKTNSIGSMVNVIRSIAEQTNLLALNAAIEAARAGDQGRGFAVVADEVRSLANSTQESTLEIENLIQALQADSKAAVDVMEQSSEQALISVEQSKMVELALETVGDFITDINDRSMHMSDASKEQSQVSAELSQNIIRINQVADKTVDKAQQTIEASEELHNLADELNVLMSQFTVGSEESKDVTLF